MSFKRKGLLTSLFAAAAFGVAGGFFNNVSELFTRGPGPAGAGKAGNAAAVAVTEGADGVSAGSHRAAWRPVPHALSHPVQGASAPAARGHVIYDARWNWPGTHRDRLEQVRTQMKDEDPATMTISARDALACATGRKSTAGLSVAQQRLVGLVADAQAIPLGREMTRVAAEHDVWYAVDNNVRGGGYYLNRLRLIALEFSDDGSGDDGRGRDDSDDAAFAKNRGWYQETLYHELVHFYQFRIWNSISVPQGVRSFDAKLWDISVESQADLIARAAMRDHALVAAGQVPAPPDPVALFRDFVDDILNGSAFHRKYYKMKDGRLNDGVAVNVDRYVSVFGSFPGRTDNFLEAHIKTHADLYAAVIWPDPELRQYYEKAREELLKKRAEMENGPVQELAMRRQEPPVWRPA